MKKSKEIGILNQPSLHCQRLEAPELPEITDPSIPHTTTESTFQLPFGQSSALSALRLGTLKPVEALLSTVLNYRSNWDSGKTWKTSYRLLSELTGLSIRYIREALSNLIANSWVQPLAIGTNTGSRYAVTHHNCRSDEIPTDKHGHPLKVAMPQGKGGILKRLFDGNISWKAALIWIFLKLHSNWKTGVTMSLSIESIRSWVHMSPQTVCNCIKELTKAGLLKRLSQPHETGVYQLYPKPNTKPKPVYRRRKPKATKQETCEMKVDGEWRLSFNQLWRVNVVTCDIQTRKSRRFGIWRDMTLGDTIPKAIQRDFDLSIAAYHQLQENLGVTDSAQGVTDSAQGVTDSAQGLFSNLFQSGSGKGSSTERNQVPACTS